MARFIGVRAGLALLFFFLNDPAPTDIYTLPLHDALPILRNAASHFLPRLRLLGAEQLRQIIEDQHKTRVRAARAERTYRNSQMQHAPPDHGFHFPGHHSHAERDRKSTRLNSSHGYISYAVFCLNKKTLNLTL